MSTVHHSETITDDDAEHAIVGAAPARPAADSDQDFSAHLPIAVVAPTGRDGALIARALTQHRMLASVCPGVDALLPLLAGEGDGEIGTAVIAEEALDPVSVARLVDVLERQPSWSDLPMVLLTGLGADGDDTGPTGHSPVGERLAARGSVTVLERPLRIATLVSAVSAALRARARQYEVRDHLQARERARAEAETARAEAEAANRVKADFLAAMSHELRTPLNAILGYAQLIELGLRGPVTEEQLESLRRISENQQHLLDVVDDILTFSRAERGELPLDIADVPIDEVLSTVHVAVEPQLTRRSLEYEYRPCAKPVLVRADRARLQRVVINFLSNAVKFTAPGGRVTLECARHRDVVSVCVRDTGRGIPPDKLERIFEPFVQLSQGYTRTAQGSGLGLTISRDLARRMGGDVSVRSEVGKGSVFTVTVPIARPSQTDRIARDRTAAR